MDIKLISDKTLLVLLTLAPKEVSIFYVKELYDAQNTHDTCLPRSADIAELIKFAGPPIQNPTKIFMGGSVKKL